VLLQRAQHVGVEHVVDEGADGGEAVGQHGGVGPELGLEKDEVVVGVLVGGFEEAAVVGLGAEDGDTHAMG
jgi:hypothetical protein